MIAKLIIPASDSDSNLEQYEYMLVWFGRNGEVLQRLFYDYEIRYNTDVENINLKDEDTIGNLFVDEQEEITLFAENINRNELDTLRSALVSKNIFRLYKDGTTEKLSVTGKRAAYKNSAQRFNFELSIYRPQNNLPR